MPGNSGGGTGHRDNVWAIGQAMGRNRRNVAQEAGKLIRVRDG